MNFTFVLAVFAAVLAVSAAPAADTNAQRLARGLPPLAPVQKRGTPSYKAKRAAPSTYKA